MVQTAFAHAAEAESARLKTAVTDALEDGVQAARRAMKHQLAKFIQTLRSSNGAQPELVVEPEGISDEEPQRVEPLSLDEIEDPLLDLFRKNPDFSVEAFRGELRKQRSPSPAPPTATVMA